MEENGGYGILTMVLRTSNLTEFLTAMDDVGEIMQSDGNWRTPIAPPGRIPERVKAEYESFKTELEGKKQELQHQQDELQAEIDEATPADRPLQEDIDSNQEEVEAILAEQEKAETGAGRHGRGAERQRQEEERNGARRKRQRPRRRGSGRASSCTGGELWSAPVDRSSFGWPVPSCTYMTSRFGLRVHPITGVKKSHTGIDIGAGYGAAIVAADGGTVTLRG